MKNLAEFDEYKIRQESMKIQKENVFSIEDF